MSLSRTVSEINVDFRRKSPIFSPPVYLTLPLKGFPLEFGIGSGVKKLELWGYQKFKERFSRLDTIRACDRHR